MGASSTHFNRNSGGNGQVGENVSELLIDDEGGITNLREPLSYKTKLQVERHDHRNSKSASLNKNGRK